MKRLTVFLIMAALWAGLVMRLFHHEPRDLRMVGQDTRPVISRRILADHIWLLDAADGWHCAVEFPDWEKARPGQFWSCAWSR